MQDFQHPLNQLPMLFLGVCENQDVVQVYNDVPLINQVLQNVVHECLEGGKGVGEAEEHDGWLVHASVGPESSLPLISFFDSNIIVPPLNIIFVNTLVSLSLSISS